MSFPFLSKVHSIRRWSETFVSACSASTGSKLIGVLFERHPHKLSARPHSGLLKQALQDRLDVALGNLQLGGDLLVGKPFQHETQHFSLPLVKLRTSVRFGPGGLLGGKVRVPLVEIGMAVRDQAHAFNQRAERTLFQKNARDALTDQPASLRIAHPGGDDQHLARKADLSRRRKELRSALRAQVVVEQNQVDGRLRQRLQRFPNRRARNHFELGARRQRAGYALPENRVVIDQQGPDCAHDTPIVLFSAGQLHHETYPPATLAYELSGPISSEMFGVAGEN